MLLLQIDIIHIVTIFFIAISPLYANENIIFRAPTSQFSNQILRNNLLFSFFCSKLSRLYIELDTFIIDVC